MSDVTAEDVLGYEVVSSDLATCVEAIYTWVKHGAGFRWLGCINHMLG